MRSDYKNPKADLRKNYIVFFEAGLIVVLVIALAAVKFDFRGNQKKVDLTEEQEVVKMEEIVQTKHLEKPPPPPRPPCRLKSPTTRSSRIKF